MLDLLAAVPVLSLRTTILIGTLITCILLSVGYLLLVDYVACVDSGGGVYVRTILGFTCVGKPE